MTASIDRANTPRIPCARLDVGTATNVFDVTTATSLVKVSVPKNQTRRRIYCGYFTEKVMDLSDPLYPRYRAELNFFLDGAVVLNIPVNRYLNQAGAVGDGINRLSIRPGAEGYALATASQGAPQPPAPDSLMVTWGSSFHTEMVIPPMHVTVTCDEIQLALQKFTSDSNDTVAVLACHSEGESDA